MAGCRGAPLRDWWRYWRGIMKNVFGKIVKGFFGWVVVFFGKTFTETADGIKNIKRAPMQNSITLALMAARIAALVMFVIAFFSFIADNGYGAQIGVIGEGVGQWSRALTMGTLHQYLGGPVVVAWTVLLGLAFFAIHIVYVISEEGFRRVLMVFLMLVVFASVVVYLLFAWGVIYERHAVIDSFAALRSNIELNQIPWFIPAIYLAVLVLALVFSSLMAVKSSLGRQMIQWLSTALSLYIGLPLLLWFAQNLLALAAMVAFLVIVGGILYILFSILYSRLGDSSETISDSHEKDSTAGMSDGQVKRSGGYSGAITGRNAIEVETGVRLWKIKSATGDYIQSEESNGETAEVCPAADFDKGRVTIVQGGEQVAYVPWKPK